MQNRVKAIFKNLGKNLHRLILFVCIGVFVFSVFMIGKKLYGYYHDNAQFQKIREQVGSNHPTDKFAEVFESSPTDNAALSPGSAGAGDSQPGVNTPAPLPYTKGAGNISELDKNGVLSDYTALKSQNSDLMGWIRMPGFKKPIDYPVMQTGDNQYYLSHDFYGNDSQAGSIFMDSRNSPLEADRHIILYGHAMKDMSMFGNLKSFPDNGEDHTKNTKVYLDLLNTRLEYEVFSTYYEDASYNYRQTDFSSDDEYLAFIERLSSKSVYDYKIELTGKDKIITLSTCNNDMGGNIRSITHARLARQIVYDGTGSVQVETAEHTSKEVVSANVYLKQLSLEYGDLEKPSKAAMVPAFSSGIKEFETSVPPEVEEARLVLEKADAEAAVEATLNGINADINSLKLAYGENIIKIKMTSRDKKYSRTITLKAVRMPQATPDVQPTASVSTSTAQ